MPIVAEERNRHYHGRMTRPITEGEAEVIISFTLPIKMRDWLTKGARDHDTSRSAVLRAAIRKFAADQSPDKWKDCR